MKAEEQRTTNPCKKLHELPCVSTEWQQTTWCPDCEYYDLGTCGNPMRGDSSAACPFDGKACPLRELSLGPNNDPQQPMDGVSRKQPEQQPVSLGLEQAVMHQIVRRTGGRIQMLEVGMVDNVVIIRGYAPCYYVKQLALQGVFDVLGSFCTSRLELNVCVPGQTMSGAHS
jgi:hypothetical protein